MDINPLIQAIFGVGLFGLVRILAAIFVFLYLIFALIIIRQVQLMSRTLRTPISPVVLFLAIINVGITLFVLIILIGTI